MSGHTLVGLLGIDRPAHRGVNLPIEMTPALADRLEQMICSYLDEPKEFPLEFGVTLFRAVHESQHSNDIAENPTFSEQIRADRLNVKGVCDLKNHIPELQGSSSR